MLYKLLSLDLVQSTFSIQLNHFIFFMQFSNPFIEDFRPRQPDSLRQPCTESQIINTLNSSIEDLLSKIFKIKEDYAISAHQEHQANYLQFQVSFSKDKVQKADSDEYKNWSSGSTKNDDKSTISQSDCSAQGISESLYNHQNQRLNHHYSFETFSKSHQNYQDFISSLNRPLSSNLILQNKFQETNTKMAKIQSLFDSQSIKQVAQSQVFFQSSAEGSYDRLQYTIRQVRQTIIEKDYQDSAPLMNSISLSDFQIGSSVGSGKFGEVYLCRHRATGMIFALKKIFKSTIIQYKMESQLCLQLKILYMLNHPNIVKLYAHFCDEYHIFLLMQYVEGGQLLSRLKSNQRYVSRVIEQVINAVDYVHNCGIVHRDIKPQNIVMAFDNTVKLCDFGWAGVVDYKNNMKTTFCGTLDYVSPQMKDKGSYTSKVDLWSIGVLTFQLLTGEAPFKDQINCWKKKGSKRSVSWDWHITYPSQISGLSESFMRNLLKQNPDERASLRFCKTHFFIRKHKQQESQINIQLYV